MNDNDTTTKPPSHEPSNKKNKIIISVAAIILLAGVSYGVAASSNIWWPFTATTTSEPQNNQVKDPPQDISNTVISPKMVIQKPTIDKKNNVLKISTVIETAQEGNCTLILSNNTRKAVFTNTTVDYEGEIGCLDWNISTANLQKGTYDISVEFVGTSEMSKANRTVTIQ